MMTGPTRTTHAAIVRGLVRLAMVLVVFGGLSAAGFAQPTPRVSIAATDPDADNDGGTGEFTISRTGPKNTALMVLFSVGGTASADDYVLSSGSPVTIPIGSNKIAITVTPVDDDEDDSDDDGDDDGDDDDDEFEGSKTVILTIIANADYAIDTKSATVTIADNDVAIPVVSIVASDATASEAGPDPGTFTVSRTGSTLLPLVVDVSVSGTAMRPADYTLAGAPLGSVTIPIGSASATLTVTPVDDAVINEGSETVIVTIDPNVLYTIDGVNANATVTIADNDTALPRVTVRASDPNSSETGRTGELTFERQGNSANALTVSYSVAGSATPGADYAALAGTVTFGPEIIAVTVRVRPVGDGVDEGEETIVVTLAPGAGYTIGSPASATVVIREPEGGLTISGPDSGVGTDPLSLSLTLDSPATEPINGTWRSLFTPDPTVPGNRQADGQIVLSTPSFSIPIGATEASPPLTVTLGTVAGTVTVIAEINGVTAFQHPITFAPGPPRVTGGEIVTQANGFDIVMFGFSSRLDVASATFVFTGPNVQQPGPVNVDAAFTAWFENPDSADDGTTFEYTQPFTVDGNRSTLTSVRVTVAGSDGIQSDPITIPIP